MAKKRILWQLFPTYLLLTLLSLTAVTWFASNRIRHFHLDQLSTSLEGHGQLLARQFERRMSTETPDSLDRKVKELGRSAQIRATLIHADGTVLGDSEEDPLRMDNHASRPEFRSALDGQLGQAIRYSKTLEMDMLYVAVPLRGEGKPIGAIRAALPLTEIERTLQDLYGNILLAGLVIILVVAGLTLLVSKKISNPLEEIRSGAEHFARGEFHPRIPVPASAEMGELAETMNRMAEQLEERIGTIERQRNELGAVLSSMREGVLAVDNEERLISCNQSGAKILRITIPEAENRSIQEVIRNSDLQNFIQKLLKSQEDAEGDIHFYGDPVTILQARGTALLDADGKALGALIVLNDVTRLRKLENIRQDFVANVSHELKTPITSIKGFAETLQEDIRKNPDEAGRFLEIISRQANRLHTIVEDLLSLSRIEQEAKEGKISLERGPLNEVLSSALDTCRVKAENKNIRLELACEEGLNLKRNPSLLEQAFVNLIDNAIKYSNQDTTIQIDASRAGEEIHVRVQDQGIGIGSQHLERLFERFYRVDKARSRKQGGTGLGLAIVKHICQAHRGSVAVESQLGKGSTFTLRFPAES